MRIVMIGQKGVPAHSGGVERHVEDLATRLAAAGHEVFVYCRKSYSTSLFTQTQYQGIRCVYLPTVRSKHLETPLHTFFASIHALTLQPDIYHYHGIGPSLWVWIPRIFAPFSKVISTFHCQDYFHQKWGGFARIVFRIGEIAACTMTHETIVVSQTLQRYVARVYGRHAAAIPNAVSIPTAVDESIIPRGLKKGAYILSVSRLVKHKGVHHIIDAYIAAHKKISNLPPLVIVGNSSYTDRYLALLKHKVSSMPDKILFLGEQHGVVLAALYQNARLFVQASESEGLSYALLEAMSYGCAIVASNIPENREVLPEGAALFDSGSAESLMEQLVHELSRHDATDGRVYQKHVQAHFSSEQSFSKTLRLYECLSHREAVA